MTYVHLYILFLTKLTTVRKPLIIPCEIASKAVVPAIKAVLAKKLIETHGLRQDNVAEILGISQSAVSKYIRKVRGHIIEVDNIKEIQPTVNKMIELIVNRPRERAEFLKLFCRTCLTIRKKGFMCQFCEKTDPNIKMEKCGFCLV